MPYTFDPDEVAIAPEGTQLMTVTSIRETESSKGDPMWIVHLTDADGHEVPEFIVHKPNIIDWKFRPLWEAAGLQWPQGRAVIDEQQLVDRQVMVTIKHEKTEQFGLQPRVHGYAPPGASDLNPSGQESMEFETPVTAGAPAPRNAIHQGDDDDDIPF